MVKMVKTDMRQYTLMETWAGCNKFYKYFVSKFAQVVFVVSAHSNPNPHLLPELNSLPILKKEKIA